MPAIHLTQNRKNSLVEVGGMALPNPAVAQVRFSAFTRFRYYFEAIKIYLQPILQESGHALDKEVHN